MFVIVSKEDFPLYELTIEGLTKRKDYAQLHEFILHSSLDVIEHLQWATPNMYLRTIDKFNELSISCLLAPSSKCSFTSSLKMTSSSSFTKAGTRMESRASSMRYTTSSSRL